MKTRRKLDRFFAMLLVFTLIFNSQATALLAMDGEGDGTSGSVIAQTDGTENEADIIDDGSADTSNEEAEENSAESGKQTEAAKGEDFLLGEEIVSGNDSASEQEKVSAPEQQSEADPLTAAEMEMLTEAETESEFETELQAEPANEQADPSEPESEVEQADPSGSELEIGQADPSGSEEENGSGTDVESGPVVDVEDDSDITIVEEETEPQTAEQGTDTQEPAVDETETEEEYEAEVVAMGLDDGIMLTSVDDPEAKVIEAGGSSETAYETFAKAVANAGDGDTVQLLKDTAEINEKIEIKDKSISIDLAGKTVKFASKVSKSIVDDANGPWLVVSNGSLTIKGSGNVKGGFYQEVTLDNKDIVIINKTVGVSADGSLSVEDQVNVDYIVNKGTTEIKDNAQVGEIRQFGGNFTLNNELNTSLDVVLGVEDMKATNAKCLEIGSQFKISGAARMILSFFATGSSVKLGFNNGRNVIDANKTGGWLKTTTSGADQFTLLRRKEGVSDEVLNDLKRIIHMDIIEAITQQPKKDEKGNPIYEDVVIGDRTFRQQVLIDRVRTADIEIAGDDIVIWRHFRDEEKFVDEKCVYVGNKGNDKNSGNNSNTAVKTIGQAIELLKKADVKKICFLDTLVIKDSQTWDLEGITLERDSECTGSSYVEVMDGGSLTLKNIIMDGGSALFPAVVAKAPLIKVEGGTLNIGEGVTLKNNNFNYSNYNSIGGAIYNNGGAVTMAGGTIERCKAYNGGAIYCDGGTFDMSSGKLNGNSAWEAGGAVMLANGAKMTLSGSAEISENNVYVTEHGSSGKGYGGGIAVGGYRATSVRETPSLEMSGGIISHNKALTCGGGIFVQANAKAEIRGGVIDNNSADNGNFGGGGIYVNGARGEIDEDASNPGYLYLENVLIAGNVSQKDVGGGIAACPTASAKIYLLDGALIYGNKYGVTQVDRVPSDILIRRDTYTSSGTEIDISEYMPNGQPYLWKEFNGDDDSGAGKLHRNDYIAQYSLYTDQTYNGGDTNSFSVRIIYNSSEWAGGGIGTNGTVVIGTEPAVTSISASKVWNDEGHTTARPRQIKVWLLRRRQDESEYEHVLADYLVPDAEGSWGSVTFTDQPIADPTDGTLYEYMVEEDPEDLGPYGSTVEEADGENNWKITNTYTATGTAQVKAKKTLTGRPEALKDQEFSFSLTPVSAVDADGKTEIKDPNAAQTGVKNATDGTVTFSDLTYSQAGTYTYELKEEDTSVAGVTKDSAVYTVTVTMADDNKGHLTPSVAYSKGTETVEARDVVFANMYKATGKASVSATKILTGRPEGLKDKEFSFSLTPVSASGTDGTSAITDPNAAQTVRNDGDGKITFKDLAYTQAGTYTYELKEEDTDEAGITKDPSVYTVTVSVTDNSLGQLLTDVKYSRDGREMDAADVVFENVYDVDAAVIQLGATKAFDRALAEGEFTFVLREVDADGKAVAAGVRQEKTNDKDGRILFDEISYDEEGIHYYQISETAGSDPTVLSYDTTVYTVTVTVKYADAELVATADLPAEDVVFTNTSVRVKLDKRDADTGAGIAGAVLQVVDRDNADKVVEKWTSEKTPHEITGRLRRNGSYALEEVSAPDGYMPEGPVEFSVNEDGETVVGGRVTDTVVMEDTKNTVRLLKLDEDGKALAGAHLVVEDAAGTAVDSWVSDGKPHETRGLARGNYVLSEVEAPAGYHVAEDVPFRISGNETEPVEVQMKDAKIPEKDNNRLTVMKHLHLEGITCDIGVRNAVFYVALFDDEARTHRVSDVKTLTFQDSAVSTATFENLGKGTYYVGETDENGILSESKVVNDQVVYYAEYGENAKAEFEGRSGEGMAELTNIYVEIPEEGFYLSGRLTITKKVLAGGEEAASEDTFYAGVFSDPGLTSRVGEVVALEMNGASSASTTVYNMSIGDSLDSSSVYYVAETDENGNPLDPEAVTEYRISVDRSEIVMTADNSEQEVVITNDFVEETETEIETEIETETETGTEEAADIPDAGGSNPGSGSPAPKTGDETDYLLYLLYMALSAGLFGAAVGQKRKRAKRMKK